MALEGYTILAAAAAVQVGGLRVGAPASRPETVFTVDPLRADPDELADAPIAMTLVNGDVVHRDGAGQ
jgi:predicted amidohydrolase YtcJ